MYVLTIIKNIPSVQLQVTDQVKCEVEITL